MKDLYDNNPSLIDDLIDVAMMLAAVVVIIVFVIMGVAFGSWFAGVLERLGFTGGVVEGIAHFTGFCLTLTTILTIFGRVVNGRWWWRT